MAAEKIFAARYFQHPTSPVAGVTHVRIVPSSVAKVDQGAAGAPGVEDAVVTKKGLTVELYGTDFAALLTLVGATAANGVVGIVGAAGANEKITLKNAYFTEPIAAIEIPETDEGGKLAPHGVRGICTWETADTFATMVLGAADA